MSDRYDFEQHLSIKALRKAWTRWTTRYSGLCWRPGVTAIDTNIVVCFLTRDDPVQFEQSVRIFATREVFIRDTVILETEWVLRYAYAFSSVQVVEAFRNLFGLPNVRVRDTMTIALALQWHEQGLDFADALHLAQSQHCQEMQTFDQRFVRRSEGLTPRPVRLSSSD